MAKVKTFPCQVCRGEGSWVEPVLDFGMGPRETCGWCDGEGVIAVGSDVHRRNTVTMLLEQIANRLIPEGYKHPDSAEKDPLDTLWIKLTGVLYEIHAVAHR